MQPNNTTDTTICPVHATMTTTALPSPFTLPDHGEDGAEYVLISTDARTQFASCNAHAAAIAWWPHADLFRDRVLGRAMAQPIGGVIEPYGGEDFCSTRSPACNPDMPRRGVIWAVTSIYPKPPNATWKNDTAARRLQYLSTALLNIGRLVQQRLLRCTTLAVPLYTGCERLEAGEAREEAWANYKKALFTFEKQFHIRILLTKPLEECVGDAPYARFPARTIAPEVLAWAQRLAVRGARASQAHIPLRGGQRSRDAMMTMASRPSSRTTITITAANAKALALFGVPIPDTIEEEPRVDRPASTKRTRRMAKVVHPPPPEVGRWTRASWFEHNIQRVFTEAFIAEARTVPQGGQLWKDIRGVLATSSKFHDLVAALQSGGRRRGRVASGVARGEFGRSVTDNQDRALEAIVHPQADTQHNFSKKFMDWGTEHEDDGKAAFVAATCMGLLDRLKPTALDMSSAPFVAHTNKQILEGALRVADGDAPWVVSEVMESRGINIDVEALVLGYSYDGLYRVARRRTDGSVPPAEEHEWVLLEVKCTARDLAKPRAAHMTQMMAMMGGLRKQGYPIQRCVYATYHRHATRFWLVPFDEDHYASLRRKILYVWYRMLLPLFVARDNGELEEGSVRIPTPLPPIHLPTAAEKTAEV